uniref:Uncharacterized protein n=1 Tax=Aegilops tauschii TaxID=37682 RepID=M8CK98_AEGTA
MGALSSAESISQSDIINDKFKKLWVEHGDELSLEYAGSYALKGDLVRYGRQTLPGLIKDGMSALSRYYLNNFHDGVRQDALDLISGYYTVSKSSSSPFQIIGFESAPGYEVLIASYVSAVSVDRLNKGKDAATAAAHAKDKLMERQEKLAVKRFGSFCCSIDAKRKMVEESAEFESEAENFATLGQQIRKSLETKRWWWPS